MATSCTTSTVSQNPPSGRTKIGVRSAIKSVIGFTSTSEANSKQNRVQPSSTAATRTTYKHPARIQKGKFSTVL
ncbi:hypothetical protein CC78DRAFT_536656, partial [Lojkania enalia]